jgi:hypothetical protein
VAARNPSESEGINIGAVRVRLGASCAGIFKVTPRKTKMRLIATSVDRPVRGIFDLQDCPNH